MPKLGEVRALTLKEQIQTEALICKIDEMSLNNFGYKPQMVNGEFHVSDKKQIDIST